MAGVNSTGLLSSPSVTLTKDTDVVYVTGGVDCGYVSLGTVILLQGIEVILEGQSGTAADPSGNSTIKLRAVYTGETLTNVPMTLLNTIEGQRNVIEQVRNLLTTADTSNDLLEYLTSTDETVTITTSAGVSAQVIPYGTLLSRLNSVETVEYGGGEF